MDFDFEVQEQYLIRGARIERNAFVSLKNWYPVTIDRKTKQVAWRDLAETRFTAPFFHSTLVNQPKKEQRICTTELSALTEFNDGIAPSAFIFHVSRCGSTLITQLISDLNHCIVLSEPPILDAFFRTHREGNQDDLKVFQHIVNTLGQKRFSDERHLIIKFDSWHIANIDFIRRAFPNVPVIFLYRDPHQVLASHQRQRGPQMIPDFVDMPNLPIDKSDLQPADFDAYTVRVLDQFFIAALKQYQKNRLTLVNYKQLPQLVWEQLLIEFQIDVSSDQQEKMKKRSQYHSKNPNQGFQHEQANVARDLTDSDCMAHYLELEALRTR